MTIKTTSKTRSLSNAQRETLPAMCRGVAHKCPACGRGKLYTSFLKVVNQCNECGEELFHHRADDAPPYFTMLITGHLLVAGALALERFASPPTWVHTAIWVPLTILFTIALLPRIKGALVGMQWALRMHGFAPAEQEIDDGGLRPHDQELAG